MGVRVSGVRFMVGQVHEGTESGGQSHGGPESRGGLVMGDPSPGALPTRTSLLQGALCWGPSWVLCTGASNSGPVLGGTE